MTFGVWSYVVAGIMALSFIGGVYQTGYNAAWRRSQIDTITTERDIARKDLAIARKAAEVAAEQAVTLSAAAAANDFQIKELTDAVAKAGEAGSCKLGDYARRLRSVR